MAVSLIAVFQHSALSAEHVEQVSLDYLLRLSLKRSSCGPPASIANLMLLVRPSNDVETARSMMDEVCRITAEKSLASGDEEDKMRYCAMTADKPLYAQMQRILRDCPDRMLSAGYERILSLTSHMHQSISFQDAMKFFCCDAGMDALAASSGLSKGTVEDFHQRKE